MLAVLRPEIGMHGLEGFVMREDRHIGEYNVAGGVVEMTMRINQHADRLVGSGFDGGAKLACQPRILLRVDYEQPMRRIDDAGV